MTNFYAGNAWENTYPFFFASKIRATRRKTRAHVQRKSRPFLAEGEKRCNTRRVATRNARVRVRALRYPRNYEKPVHRTVPTPVIGGKRAGNALTTASFIARGYSLASSIYGRACNAACAITRAYTLENTRPTEYDVSKISLNSRASFVKLRYKRVNLRAKKKREFESKQFARKERIWK